MRKATVTERIGQILGWLALAAFVGAMIVAGASIANWLLH